jgi:2-succinyl-5-enolpyruvyl-6-hydroxy-3-cyclohexene-1-carboxylate synthase
MSTDNLENLPFESGRVSPLQGSPRKSSAVEGVEEGAHVLPGSERDVVDLIISRYAPESVQHLFACLLVEELIRTGVSPFVISPGMRAVPLLLALEGSASGLYAPSARRILVNDERSAGFFAVGAAKSGAFPCLICTSGTAVANYHPAVVEAWHSRIPLLVISTDRPWELLHAGANQTIDQKGVFRDCTVQTIDVPAPDTRVHVHSLLSTIDYLVAKARTELRPVHLNLGFRKPFYDERYTPAAAFEEEDRRVLSRWLECSGPYVAIKSVRGIYSLPPTGKISVESEDTRPVKKKVVVIAGPSSSPHWERRSEVDSFPGAVLEKTGSRTIPVLADIHSNMRQLSSPCVCAAYQWYLRELVDAGDLPDIVLYVGDRIISTACQEFLQAVGENPLSRIIKFQTSSDREDAVENEFMPFTHVTPYLDEALSFLPSAAEIDHEYSERILTREKDARERIHEVLGSEATSERSYVRSLIGALPAGVRLMLSASAIFREADNFAHDIPAGVLLYGNRGATGIDGILSSGIGLGSAGEEGAPVCILVGDQATLHDLTALSLLRYSKKPVVIVVINNQGGALFNIIGKSRILPSLLNEHPLNFRSFAEGFGVSYHRAAHVQEAVEKMKEAFTTGRHLLLEIPVDGKASAVQLTTLGE